MCKLTHEEEKKQVEAALNQIGEQLTHVTYPGNLADELTTRGVLQDADEQVHAYSFKRFISIAPMAAAAMLMLVGSLAVLYIASSPSNNETSSITIASNEAEVESNATELNVSIRNGPIRLTSMPKFELLAHSADGQTLQQSVEMRPSAVRSVRNMTFKKSVPLHLSMRTSKRSTQ